MHDETARGTSQRPATPGPITPLTLLIAALMLLAWAPYLAWMWGVWMKSPYYSHGPIIVLLSAYLIYSRRKEFLTAGDSHGHAWGIALIVASLALHARAMQLDVNFPQGFAMIGVIGGAILWLWGWQRASVVLFPVAFLSFMVPVDRLLVTKLSNPLQIAGAKIAAHTPMILGIPTEVHGTTIRIPDYTFEVAQACSGLKSTIAMTALAALFAYLIAGPMYKRILIFIAGIPVALAANACRISFTVLLGQSFGQKAADGFFHSLSGIMVFMVGLIGLFLVAKVLKCDTMREDIM